MFLIYTFIDLVLIFSVGEQIFVEGINKNGIGGSGFNSEDYGFRFFEVISYENLIPETKFSVAGLTNVQFKIQLRDHLHHN